MANLRADNLTGIGGRNAIEGSVFFNSHGHGSSNNFNALSLADSTDWYFDGDFTVECWIKPGRIPDTSGAFLGQWVSGGGTDRNVQLYIGTNGVVTGYMNRSTTNYSAGSVGALSSGEWSHIALVLEGSTLRFYWNGKQTATATVSGTQNNGTSKFFVGAEANSSGNPVYGFNGYLSNVRVVKGTAVYAGGTTFTPPTEKLKAIDGTVLLCCQDSDNVLQEATGKTITGYGNYYAATGELFANTGFSADSGWTKGSGWTISGNVATHAQGSAGDLYQAVSGLVVGQTYKLSVDILTSDEDVSYFYIDNNPGGNYPALGDGSNTLVGYHEIFFEANATTMWLGFRGSSLWAGTLTNLRLSSYEAPNATKSLPPVGVDEGVTFDGDTKINSQSYMYFPTGDTSQRGRGRGIFISAANSGNWTNVISYIQIQSMGNALDFGDLIYPRRYAAGASSATRGVVGAGIGPSWPANKTTEYSTLATTGNALSFGELSDERYGHSAIANSTRVVWGGGYAPAPVGNNVNTIEYVTTASTGDSTDFGDLTDGSSWLRRYIGQGISNGTRGVLAGGYSGSSWTNDIIYIPNLASLSNSSDFGSLSGYRGGVSACSDSTRGVFFGGYYPTNLNTIDYVTIASTGDASDFGDITVYSQASQACASPTRAVRGAGAGNPANQQVMDYVTIATRGDAIHFGELASIFGLFPASLSSTTRGIFAGGTTPTKLNTIEYITIATLGNATDFGDLTVITYGAAGSSNQVRGVIAGGGNPSGDRNEINYITIATTANALDFGDLTTARATVAGCSDSGGGLG